MGSSGSVRTGLLLAMLGVGLLVVGLQTVHFGEQPEFHYHVQPGPADEAALNDSLGRMDASLDRDDVVFDVSSLSHTTQEIIWAALAAEDGQVTRRGFGNGASEFEYPGDHSALGHGQYYLTDGDDYYRLSTRGDSGFPGLFEMIAAGVLFVVATPLALYGLARTDSLRVTASTLPGLGTVTALSAIGFGWFGRTGLLELIGIGLAVGAVSGLAVWFVIGEFSTAGRPVANRNGTNARNRGVSLAYGGLGVLVILGLYAFVDLRIDLVKLATLCFLGFASGAAVEWHRAALSFPRRERRAGD